MRFTLFAVGVVTVAACGGVSSSKQDAAPADDAAVDASPPADAAIDAAILPATSCLDAKGIDPAATTGVYSIDPDGQGPIVPFSVFCDMDKDGGGWMLAMSLAVDPVGLTWTDLVPSFTPPQSTTESTTNVLHHTTLVPANVSQMMLMGGDRILKLYYPRTGVDFTANYRDITERAAFRVESVPNDAPHTGSDRDGCGHLNDACTTTDFAAFKAADPACLRDPTNSHAVVGCVGNCGTFGHCPGQGQTPPDPLPNCWFFGGTNATDVPQISACPAGSQAAFANYAPGVISGFYAIWLR